VRADRRSDVEGISIQHDFGRFAVWRERFEEDYLAPMLAALFREVRDRQQGRAG
jgi:hypothetical protein